MSQMKTLNKKSEKRANIVNAAINLLTEKGFKETKMSQIAKLAGVADGTIYIYFKNKDDLMMKALNEILVQNLEEIKLIVAEEVGVRLKIVRFFELNAEVFTKNPQFARFIVEDLRQIKNYYSSYPLYSIFDAYREYVKELHIEGVKEGELREVSPDIFSLTVIGAMDFMLSQWILKGQSFSLSEAVLQTVDLVHFGSGVK